MTPDTNDSDLRARVTALEHWRTQREIAEARKDEQWKHMDQRFTDLDKKIDGLNGTLTWIVRLIVGGIISGIVAFLISGGFRAL